MNQEQILNALSEMIYKKMKPPEEFTSQYMYEVPLRDPRFQIIDYNIPKMPTEIDECPHAKK